MRKRAMVMGLLLVPLATGGAVLLAKSIHQSTPGAKATITLPESDGTPSEYSSGEGSGFVIAPSDANAETRELNEQSEEQPKGEVQKQPSSEDIDSDHAAAEVLFASDNESAEIEGGSPPVISSPHDFFNSYAFANSRRSSGGAASSGAAGASSGSGGSAPSADSKSPQSTSTPADEPAEHGESQDTVPEGSDAADEGTGGPTHDPEGPTEPVDEPIAEETPPQVIPVPYFPPEDARPHVTVPEPSTLMLLGLGLLACAAASRRRRAKVK